MSVVVFVVVMIMVIHQKTKNRRAQPNRNTHTRAHKVYVELTPDKVSIFVCTNILFATFW